MVHGTRPSTPGAISIRHTSGLGSNDVISIALMPYTE
jgi:hypothetical protein